MDEGTYTQRDYWNKEISTVKVVVTRELGVGFHGNVCLDMMRNVNPRC